MNYKNRNSVKHLDLSADYMFSQDGEITQGNVIIDATPSR